MLRYVKWLGNFATGDLGESIRFKGPVADVMLPAAMEYRHTGVLDICHHDPTCP
jgi:ABC-type dipeptide/oligopeptide/nickel transport system permease component